VQGGVADKVGCVDVCPHLLQLQQALHQRCVSSITGNVERHETSTIYNIWLCAMLQQLIHYQDVAFLAGM
jgi:hypothetical protein